MSNKIKLISMDQRQIQDGIIKALADGPLRAAELQCVMGDDIGLLQFPIRILLTQGRIQRNDILVDGILHVDTEYELVPSTQHIDEVI